MGGATAQAASSQVVRSWERNVGGSHENLDRNRNALDARMAKVLTG